MLRSTTIYSSNIKEESNLDTIGFPALSWFSDYGYAMKIQVSKLKLVRFAA